MNTDPVPFAVDLSNDGIFLWHRKPAKKWEFLGSVPLTSGNLRQQLENMKEIVRGVEAPSNDAIVRIPTAEVQTLTVAHDPGADDSWEIRIVSALEAASDLPIRDLAFDIDRGDGTSDISVAWTPMGVVKQAETFVHLIGFTPVRYTTDVNVADFPRSPNFQLADYQASTEDLMRDDNAPGIQSQPDVHPTPQIGLKAIIPKDSFGIMWLVALFVILALLFAVIYFWPKSQETADLNVNFDKDQPFFALKTTRTAIHFEKSKTIL
jgi:hypothetical protein